MSEDKLHPPPSAARAAAMQAGLDALHLLDGLALIALAQLLPVDALGPALSTPRMWASGVSVFATFVAVVVSTGLCTVVYRTVATFPRWPPARARAALAAGMLAANALGCFAALVAIALWVTSTLVGDVHLR